MPLPSNHECRTGTCGCEGMCAHDVAYDRAEDDKYDRLEALAEQYGDDDAS